MLRTFDQLPMKELELLIHKSPISISPLCKMKEYRNMERKWKINTTPMKKAP